MATIGKIGVNLEEFALEWRIEKFSSLSNEYYASPSFYFSDVLWCLNIYPEGNIENNAEGFISVYLFRKSHGPQIDLECCFSLKTSDQKENERKQFAHAFIRRKRGFGVPFFLSRSQLKGNKSDLMPSDVLTVLCTLRRPKSDKDAGDTVTVKCSYCEEHLNAELISSHEKKCLKKPIKCPECSEHIALNCYEHECQTTAIKGDILTAEILNYFKENLNSEKIPSDEKSNPKEPIRCTECSGLVNLQNCDTDDQQHVTIVEDDESLTADYKKVLLGGKHHDVILNIGGKELRAHKDILRVRSRVFESMLDHDMKEKKSGVVDIPDCDSQAMELFLLYVYTGKLETLDQSNMLGLYYIADKYDMEALKRICGDFIRKSFSTTNICEIIQLSLDHSDTSLLESANEFFMGNIQDIMRTVEWENFLKDNTAVANELLLKAFQKLNP